MYNPPNYPNHSSQKIIQPESVLANRQDLVMPLVHPKWPEFNPEKAKTKTIQYILDSRDRNISAYPDANKYILQLFNNFDNVLSIELRTAFIPSSGYNINESNNTFYINNNGVEETLKLEQGIYQMDDDPLLAETYLYNGIDELFSDNNYSYIKSTYSKLFNKTIIYTDFNKVNTTPDLGFNFNGGTFNYDNNLGLTDTKYKSRSIGYNLGFKPIDLTFRTDNIVTYNGSQMVGDIIELLPKKIAGLIKDSNNEIHIRLTTDTKNTIVKLDYSNISTTNTINIQFVHGDALLTSVDYTFHSPFIIAQGTTQLIEDPYILLSIRDMSIYDARDKNSSKAFCKIPLEREVDFDNLSGTGIIKHFSGPKTIDKFDIKFLRYNRLTHNTENILYDFKGKDHILTFSITTTNTPYVG